MLDSLMVMVHLGGGGGGGMKVLHVLVVSANPSFHHTFTFQLGSSTITPSTTARNLGVVI